MSFVPLVLVVVLFWLCVFYVGFKSQGLSVIDFLYGAREPIPSDLGTWKEVSRSSGQVRQERRLAPGGQPDPGFLIVQVRYVDEQSGDIVRVVPEVRETRRRKKS